MYDKLKLSVCCMKTNFCTMSDSLLLRVTYLHSFTMCHLPALFYYGSPTCTLLLCVTYLHSFTMCHLPALFYYVSPTCTLLLCVTYLHSFTMGHLHTCTLHFFLVSCLYCLHQINFFKMFFKSYASSIMCLLLAGT